METSTISLADYQSEVLRNAENIIDYYKEFVKREQLDLSDIMHSLNELLITYLIENDGCGKADKTQMKELVDCCLVAVQHLDDIMKLQKKHDLYED